MVKNVIKRGNVMSIQTVEQALKEKITTGQNFVMKYVDIGQGSKKLNDGVLQAEKSAEYIQALTSRTAFLDQIKMITSHNHKRELDFMSFDVELEAGRVNGTPQVLSNYQDPDFMTKAFNAEEYRALTGLHRTTLYDSIEGKSFMNTVTQKFGEANGRALERILIYGNTKSTDSTASSGYKVNDGIIKKIQDNGDIPEETIDLTATDSNPLKEVRRMIDAFPDVYIEDKGMAMFVPRKLRVAVARYIADNKDNVDAMTYITQDKDVVVEDIHLVEIPAFSTLRNGFTKKPVILTHRENIQTLVDPDNIIVESDFNLRANTWDIASTMYADIQFGYNDATSLAFLKEA